MDRTQMIQDWRADILTLVGYACLAGIAFVALLLAWCVFSAWWQARHPSNRRTTAWRRK